jgi:Tfp pilus assembly protein PilF
MHGRLALITVLIVLALVGVYSITNEQSHLKRAADLLDAGKHRAAIKVISSAIKSDPSNVDAYTTSISLLSSHKRYKDAALIADSLQKRLKEKKLDRKLARDELVSIYISLGLIYQKVPDLARAECAYKEALALAPDSPILLNNLGWFYADNGLKLNEALRLTKRAVSLAPNDGNIIDSLGWTMYKLGRFKAAVGELERAVLLKPDSPELRYHLGATYIKNAMHEEAYIELKKSLILDNNMIDASTLLKTLQI